MIAAALIGLGNIAWKYDARKPDSPFALSQAGAMRRHPDITLLGGCAPDLDDREGFFAWSRGLATFAEPEVMLETLQPELVGICSPTEKHYAHTRMCLESGVRMIWLEKPPAATQGEVEALLCLAQEKQATVCVNFFRRYIPVYQRLRGIVRDGEMGQCHLLRILYSPGLARNGVHLLDQLFFLTGADSYDLQWVERRDPANPAFVLDLSTGQRVQACGADLSYHSNEISAICDEGIVTLSRGGQEARVEQRTPNALFPGFYDLRIIETHPIVRAASIDNYMQPALDDLVTGFISGTEPQSNLRSASLSLGLLEEILRRAAQ